VCVRGAGRLDPQTGGTNSISPAVFVHLGFEAIRHPRRLVTGGHVAPRARHASTAAVASVRTFPRPAGMVLADPAAVLAEGTFHQANSSAPAWVNVIK
jgi:hypothetical protein